MPTTPAEEDAWQQRWRDRARGPLPPAFDQLLANEFLPPDEHRRRTDAAVAGMARWAAGLPFYRERFRSAGLDPGRVRGLADLTGLAPVTRTDVQAHAATMQPAALPPGEQAGGWTATSGTTGQPTRVAHTRRSRLLFHLLKQRELRWFRLDPAGTLAAVRPGSDLPERPPAGGEVRRPAWPLVGDFFHTGPFAGLDSFAAVEDQLAWLHRERPDYLLTQSAALEHLALVARDAGPPPGLRGVAAIAQQLTADMRRLAEETFGVPVYQNYGFNEVGIVAVRCPEGERYHVHPEQCAVEVVDPDGSPTPPGRYGRLLVTALTNPAMPLLRYDPDDLARVADAPCPCGRTLPAVADVWGRYRRFAHLPAGTYQRWTMLRRTLRAAPAELSGGLRQYQLYQHRDGRCELRVRTDADPPPAFADRLTAAWAAAAPAAPAAPLAVVRVAAIPRSAGGKFVDLVSEFTPPADDAPPIPDLSAASPESPP